MWRWATHVRRMTAWMWRQNATSFATVDPERKETSVRVSTLSLDLLIVLPKTCLYTNTVTHDDKYRAPQRLPWKMKQFYLEKNPKLGRPLYITRWFVMANRVSVSLFSISLQYLNRGLNQRWIQQHRSRHCIQSVEVPNGKTKIGRERVADIFERDCAAHKEKCVVDCRLLFVIVFVRI